MSFLSIASEFVKLPEPKTTLIKPNLDCVRVARPGDVPGIADLINSWAERGVTIARSPLEIAQRVSCFSVAIVDGLPGASTSVEPFGVGVAEIRSVAVAERCQGLGAGRVVMSHAMERAAAEGIRELFLLTRVPVFFEKLGFSPIDPSEAPAGYTEEVILGNGRTISEKSMMMRRLAVV